MIIFALFGIVLTAVLYSIHTKAVDGALKEMGLLRFLSHARLTYITVVAAIGLLIVNLFTHVPLLTGILFLMLAAVWLMRTISSVVESRRNTGKTNIKYTYQKMYNEHGDEIDAEAIEAFLDGRMEDLNQKIDEAEADLEDAQRRLLGDESDEEGESCEECSESGGQSSGEGEASRSGDGEGTRTDQTKYSSDGYAFKQGDRVKILSSPNEDNSMIGTEFSVTIRIPNIKLVNAKLEGHGYWYNGTMFPASSLTKIK